VHRSLYSSFVVPFEQAFHDHTMTAKPHHTRPNRRHGGSSRDEIQNEPDWTKTHNHRIGFRDRNDRHPGYTHVGDEGDTVRQSEFLALAKKESEELSTELKHRKLLNVREFMAKQEVCI
jgi:nitrate reductase (NAD(P)H)